MRRNLRAILKELDGKKKTSKPKARKLPTDRFQSDIEDALWTLIRVETNKNSEHKNKLIALNNFQVNAVASIEVLFKGIILRNNRLWSPEGIEGLLKENVSLGEAYKILKRHKITPQLIIVETFSFSDFWMIGTYMQKLLNLRDDFFSMIETYTFPRYNWELRRAETKTLLTLHPNWRKEIQLMYDERNRFVHEGIASKKKIDDLGTLYPVLKDLGSLIGLFFAEVFSRET